MKVQLGHGKRKNDTVGPRVWDIAQGESEAWKTSNSKIVAAIPCFNTKRLIADVVSRARKYVDEVIGKSASQMSCQASRSKGLLKRMAQSFIETRPSPRNSPRKGSILKGCWAQEDVEQQRWALASPLSSVGKSNRVDPLEVKYDATGNKARR